MTEDGGERVWIPFGNVFVTLDGCLNVQGNLTLGELFVGCSMFQEVCGSHLQT